VGIEVYRIKFPWGMDANEYARKVTPAVQSLRLLINGAAWLGGSASSVAQSKNGTASHVAPASSSLAASLAADTHDEAAKKERGSSRVLMGCEEVLRG
jgi:hypothetical protein